MNKFLFIVISSLIICSTASAKKNFLRDYFFDLIEDKGSTGFVLRYHNEKNPNKFEIILPKNSPPIISDYHSRYGVLGVVEVNQENMVVLIFIKYQVKKF